jgi:hypothetical protein
MFCDFLNRRSVMIKKSSIWALFFISLFVLSNVAMADGKGKHHHDRGHDQQRLLIKLLGYSEAYVPDWDVPNAESDVVCQDMDLVDLQSNEVIGSATDCFSSINPDSGGGAGFTGTSFLHFPEGTIVSQGKFTAQPVLEETISSTGVPITAITGTAAEGNTIISGTGKYENVKGNVRVSGQINGEEYAFMPGDPIYFDCIFEIQLFNDAGDDSDSTEDNNDT